MAAADLGDRLPVAVGRDGGGDARPHHRLGDERGHVPGSGMDDRSLELERELLGRAQGVGPGLPRPVRVGRADMPEAAQPRLVRPPQRPPAGEVQRSERVAVVAAPAGDDDKAVRLAARQVVGTSLLEGRLDRLRAAGDRVDGGLVERQERAELGGVALERLVGEEAAMGVGETARLIGHDLGDAPPTVADVDDDRAPGRVQIRLAVDIPDGRALGARGDRRLGQHRAAEDGGGAGGALGHRRRS